MPRIALFIDGENLSASHAPHILRETARLGSVDLRRVYGDAIRLAGWEAVPGLRLVHSGNGKNSADLLLTVDAMEVALTGGCEVVAIASSDGDFRHVAERMRERGLTVLGLGDERAPEAFRAVCSRFVELRDVGKQAVTATGLSLEGGVLDKARWPAAITALIEEYGEAGRLPTHRLGLLMGEVYGVHIRNFAEKQWARYLKTQEDRFRLEPGEKGSVVGLRPQARALAAE